MKFKHHLIAAAALGMSLALQAGADVQLLPAGEFAGRDGRPGGGKTWKLNDIQGQALAAKLNARHSAGRAEFNFDYQHQTLLAEQNGQPAPASGWASAFEWRPGVGLFALNARWTDRAQQMIASDEYRHISPVIVFETETGVVLDVLNAALTNYPNLMNMAAVNQAVTQLNASFTSTANPNQTESDMALLALLSALMALPAETTEAQAVEAVKLLKAKAEAPPPKAVLPAALSAALGLSAGADETAALSAVTQLQTVAKAAPGSAAADPLTLQVVKDLQGQVASLSAQINQQALGALVEGAIAAGKLLPAQKDWATKLGQTSMEQLSAFIKDAPVVAAGLGTQQTGGKEAGTGTGTGVAALTADELKVATALGIKPEDFKAAAAV